MVTHNAYHSEPDLDSESDRKSDVGLEEEKPREEQRGVELMDVDPMESESMEVDQLQSECPPTSFTPTSHAPTSQPAPPAQQSVVKTIQGKVVSLLSPKKRRTYRGEAMDTDPALSTPSQSMSTLPIPAKSTIPPKSQSKSAKNIVKSVTALTKPKTLLSWFSKKAPAARPLAAPVPVQEAVSEATLRSDIATSSLMVVENVSAETPSRDASTVAHGLASSSTSASGSQSLTKPIVKNGSLKRTREDSDNEAHNRDADDEEDCSGSNSSDSGKRPPKKKKRGQKKSRKTADRDRELREKWEAGTLEVNPKREESWRSRIREVYPKAEFHDGDPVHFRHHPCGNWVKGKHPYDATRARHHIHKGCPALAENSGRTKDGGGMLTLEKMAEEKAFGWKNPDDQPFETSPCPGLTLLDDSRIPPYLQRMGALGGGGEWLVKIAKRLFLKTFSKLRKLEKSEVLTEQQHTWKWRNDHAEERVYSVDCKRKVEHRPHDRPPACLSCRTVLLSRPFRNTLAKKTPTDGNYIYVNHRFRPKGLARIFARTIGLRTIIDTEVSLLYNRILSAY